MKNFNGQIICDSNVVEDTKQKRIQIPRVIEEITGVKKGDKFRWYVESNKNGWLKISAVFMGESSCASYKFPKQENKR